MQFNQTNKNQGDVNNAISQNGPVMQAVGDRNQIASPKESFWATLWGKLKGIWKMIAG